ncbi:ADP-binding protein [Slackia heliotrinireducens]|uniref:tRNA threonylcarbamoyladenosine biosynthesis protein TsaE n=1 Tax=Slackia heliotrinireducens (strain ATCC 29202 / DSM 20476 / NCTC 11029 / RHS 1) TaxID=471855 RepID=C7N7V7_SLAHD|nr:tRNA (adenosine(37)-N6)-threonylcarbamoyltransferase complex ATPase subunit type 1 TsaE [Slackia heliotrinireducens]ACV22992.1 conserved hypothetical nucleotide-binding protein [Slackia heliotrinireducens DSM 20476]VEH01877.1 ADP-binding protein [Slackia heliotrinireducens]
MSLELESASVEQTQEIAQQIARLVEPGDVILLNGDLGAGKTHFTQGLAAGLETPTVPTSPTFNIMFVYEGGRLPLYHFDLYRLEDADELEDIDYYGTIEGDGVSVVEWADKFEDAQPDECLAITIRILPDQTRVLSLEPYGGHFEDIVAAIA